jgi:hypothetical protein
MRRRRMASSSDDKWRHMYVHQENFDRSRQWNKAIEAANSELHRAVEPE